MDFFTQNTALTLFLPLWISLILLAGIISGIVQNRKMTLLLTLISTLTGLIFGIALFVKTGSIKGAAIENIFYSLETPLINIPVGTRADKYSSIFLSAYMLIATVIQYFSYGYLKDKNFYTGYFIGMNLLNFSMTGLFLSPGLFQFFIFSFISVIITYLMQSFNIKNTQNYYHLRNFGFINIFGDSLLFISLLIISYLMFSDGNESAIIGTGFQNIESLKMSLYGVISPEIYNFTCVLFVVYILIKSMQIPLYSIFVPSDEEVSSGYTMLNALGISAAGVFFFIRILPVLNDIHINIICIVALSSAIICIFKKYRKDN